MKYDLAIVGAGILGAAHAYHAAKKGLKVLLLEKDHQPQGATVRNFGQAVASGCAGAWFDHALESQKIYETLSKKYKLPLAQNGSLYVASDQHEWELCKELYEIHKNMGYTPELLKTAKVMAKCTALSSTYVKGGLYYPTEFSISPSKFIHEFLKLLVHEYTVDYQAGFAVTGIHENATGCQVTTSNGLVHQAVKVLFCGGDVVNILFPEILQQSELVLCKLQMLKTAALRHIMIKENILTGLSIRRYESFGQCASYNKTAPNSQYKDYLDLGIHILFKQEADGSLIIGDSHEYSNLNSQEMLGYEQAERTNRLILEEAEKILYIKLKEKVVQSWTGYYTQHPSGIFRHFISNQIQICTGIGGKGMTTSLGFAQKNLLEFWDK